VEVTSIVDNDGRIEPLAPATFVATQAVVSSGWELALAVERAAVNSSRHLAPAHSTVSSPSYEDGRENAGSLKTTHVLALVDILMEAESPSRHHWKHLGAPLLGFRDGLFGDWVYSRLASIPVAVRLNLYAYHPKWATNTSNRGANTAPPLSDTEHQMWEEVWAAEGPNARYANLEPRCRATVTPLFLLSACPSIAALLSKLFISIYRTLTGAYALWMDGDERKKRSRHSSRFSYPMLRCGMPWV